MQAWCSLATRGNYKGCNSIQYFIQLFGIPYSLQVGFMNDGRIVAADIQYYNNAGNTIDESVLVGNSCCVLYLLQH